MDIALVPDGSSDRVLLPPIRWLLNEIDPSRTYRITFVDLRAVGRPMWSVADRLAFVARRQTWDMILIHRDAEARPRADRVSEVEAAVDSVSSDIGKLTAAVVPVVPVRMSEAWLLFDEVAIRRAAGRVRGSADLGLPGIGDIEKEVDPKETLFEALRIASERTGRRRRKLRPGVLRHTVADSIADWSPLAGVASFAALRDDLTDALRASIEGGAGEC